MNDLFDKIPAHIRYPGLVVAILAGAVIAQVFLVRAALSGGGPQIEQDYYTRALKVEERGAKLAASKALGWSLTVTPQRDGEVSILVTDAAGQPLTDLIGEVTLTRPHLAEFEVTHGLEPMSTPGLYTVEIPRAPRGLWDVTVYAQRRGQKDATTFQQTVRSEW